MHVWQLLPVHQVRVLAIGPQGEILGRVRGYNWRVARSAVTVQADTVIAAHLRAARLGRGEQHHRHDHGATGVKPLG